MPNIKKQRPKKKATPKKTVAKKTTKPKSVLDRIAPMSFDDEGGIKTALWGRSGSGKTTLAATFPDPILWVVCTNGKADELRSVRTEENLDRISKVKIEEATEVVEVVTDPIIENYETVVIDHASGLHNKIMARILNMDKMPEQLSWGLAKQQEWGQGNLQFQEIMRKVLDLPQNVVVIAQEREFNQDEESEVLRPWIGPGLTPGCANWLNSEVDYLAQTFIRIKTEMKEVKTKVGKTVKTTYKEVECEPREVEYCLNIAPEPGYMIKFRIPKGHARPETIVDPDYEKIMAYISGE